MRVSQWDVIIIGDGSGTGWNDANGYASILIDKETRGRKTCWGANRFGSVNMAEMEAYLKPLIWFDSQYGKQRLKRRSPLYVHIITDSQTTSLHGTQAANMSHELPSVSHRPMWAAMRELGRMGYALQYHWAKRCDSSLNTMADLIAGFSRREILGIDSTSPQIIERATEAIRNIQFCDPANGRKLNAYEINPEGDSDAPGQHTYSG